MGPRVYVQVIGFRDAERHALNTLFRLSKGRAVSYGLWTPEASMAPHLALIDLEADEGGLDLASPGLNPNLKVMCVGQGAPANAWHTFERPLNWTDVVGVMDSLFSCVEPLDLDLDCVHTVGRVSVAPSFKASLLVDPSREDRMYQRARLALAGYCAVDEADTGALALEMAKKRHYDVVIVGLDLPDLDGWELIRQLIKLEPAIGSVVVTSTDKTWHMREHAEGLGCRALLEKPYNPLQFINLLQKI